MTTVPLSEARSELVRERVLEGAAAVLGQGEPLTFAAVASVAGVPERTLYRHFPTREALLGALFAWVNRRLAVDAARATDAESLARLVRQVFPGFDAFAPVVRELLATPEGRQARLADNPARQRAALALVEHELPALDGLAARRVAAALQLLGSASSWQVLRDYWQMDGAEAAETVVLASELLLEAARSRQRASARAPRPRKKARRAPEVRK